MSSQFKVGDWVIYRQQKHSTSPGPRAEDIRPARRGEEYTYLVDKFWIVVAVNSDGSILAKTRTGKEHVLDQDDPSLRKARWWERILWRSRFRLLPGESDQENE